MTAGTAGTLGFQQAPRLNTIKGERADHAPLFPFECLMSDTATLIDQYIAARPLGGSTDAPPPVKHVRDGHVPHDAR